MKSQNTPIEVFSAAPNDIDEIPQTHQNLSQPASRFLLVRFHFHLIKHLQSKRATASPPSATLSKTNIPKMNWNPKFKLRNVKNPALICPASRERDSAI
jgi:hypothetical protein